MQNEKQIPRSSRSLANLVSLKTLERFFIILASVLCPCAGPCFSQTVLWQCTFDESGATAADIVAKSGATPYFSSGTTSIIAGGHDGRKAISWYYSNSGNETGDIFAINIAKKQEITFVYWEKFDVASSASSIWNVKSIRVFNDQAGQNFLGGIMSRWGAGFWQQGNFGSAKLATTPLVITVNTTPDYCPGSGHSFTCNPPTPPGRTALNWAIGSDTSWYKIRIYMKAPSSDNAADGVTKVWINEGLMYTLSEMTPDLRSQHYPYFTSITVHPSDDFLQAVGGNRFPFHHLYDDMILYEGLVLPPGAADTAVPVAPSNLVAVAVSSTQINLSWRDNSTNEAGFQIEYKVSPTGTWASLGMTNANATTFSKTGLGASHTFYFRVSAANSNGFSLYSNEANATTNSAHLVPAFAGGDTKGALAGTWVCLLGNASQRVITSEVMGGVAVYNVSGKNVGHYIKDGRGTNMVTLPSRLQGVFYLKFEKE